jgi:hypothetical protein
MIALTPACIVYISCYPRVEVKGFWRVAYKIPRTELDKCKERDDLKQSGVYFLFGTFDTTADNVVYIGQAGARKNGEGILNRVQEHKRYADKDYWTEAMVNNVDYPRWKVIA